MRKKVFLFDGNSFCYRAYYAIGSMTTSWGFPTNALYGFLTMLNRIIEMRHPDYMAVCFDVGGKTFRHERFADYKAHRKPMPDDLLRQIPVIKEYLKLAGIKIFEKQGVEADDLLGSLAVKLKQSGLNVFIVTPDKDALQLVEENINIYNLKKKQEIVYNIWNIEERLGGITPQQVTDFMGLVGDSSDNIPGVKGVGEKTALKYIKEYGSLENLYENICKIKGKIAEKLLADKEKAFLSRELAVIDKNVAIDFSIDELLYKQETGEKLINFYKKYEFRSFYSKNNVFNSYVLEKNDYIKIDNKTKLFDLIECLAKQKAISFDTETTGVNPFNADLLGMSFSFKERQAFYVPVNYVEGLSKEEVLQALKPILECNGIKKYGQNIKYDILVMRNCDIKVSGVAFDTMVAAYLINPAKLNQSLDALSLEYLNLQKISFSSLCGSGKNQITLADVEVDKVTLYACEDADCVWRLVPLLRNEIERLQLGELFEKLEMPLLNVLAEMEFNGINIDVALLSELSLKTEKELNGLRLKIYEAAGEEFNINSTKQLAYILFEKLRLPAKKKNKIGYSTNVDVLEELAVFHNLPSLVLEYREYAKLKSTYLDALPSLINKKTGRLHASFNQAVTVTGRLSSSSPNVQNIPVKTQVGREIRKAFIAGGKNRKIIAADYSQIELRLLAHFSEDDTLLEAFREDRDIHKVTAALLYGVGEKKVTRDMRYLGKIINFSIIYGKTAFGLSKDLKISVVEAKTFIENYFKRYAKIKDYLESLKATAHKQGYVETILGRRVVLPNINSSKTLLKNFAERAAMNAPLQGSAADLIKTAMILIAEEFAAKDIDALMIMQVHDELVFDVAEKHIDEALNIIKTNMENALPLKVRPKVSINISENWFK